MNARAIRQGSYVAVAGEGAARVMHRCALLARITERQGQILRMFLSPAMEAVHRAMRPWMETAGMTVTVDRVGNLRGLYPAERGDAPRLLIGSHLDTVPNAGAYDGVLGVLMGVALAEGLAGQRLPFAIEVVGFSDEEGTRFGVPFLGSRAVVGELGGELLDCADERGGTVRQALAAFSAAHPEVVGAQLAPGSAAYLEFHIEQGPVLESENRALGIVEGLAGQSRGEAVFRGKAGHAGTTPMNIRRDALAAAAEWMTRVEAIAGQIAGTIATVGKIEAEPGAVNVIPGVARCNVDVRHAEDAMRDAAVSAIFEEAQAIARRRGIAVEARQYHEHPAVQLNAAIVEMAAQAVKRAGYATMRMTSGAGHDAMIMAPHLPAAMIFLRNPGGISHHPDESVAEQDVAAGLHAGLCFLDEFAPYLNEHGGRVSV